MKHVVLKAFVVMLAGFLYVGDISAAGNDSYVLESPDGRNKVMITAVPKVGYEVYRNGSRIISWSPLSMDVSGELWGEGGRPRKIGRNSVEQPVYFPVPRKYASTVEIYNSLELFYKGYSIEFRAYNDAVAYRFVGRSSAEGEIRSEHVRYNFPADFKSRTLLTDKLQNWFEANYTVSPLSEIPEDKLSMHPLMVDMPSCKAVITEANLYDYAGIYFRAMDGGFTGEFAYYPKEEAFFENGDKLYVTEREDYIVRCRLDRPRFRGECWPCLTMKLTCWQARLCICFPSRLKGISAGLNQVRYYGTGGTTIICIMWISALESIRRPTNTS